MKWVKIHTKPLGGYRFYPLCGYGLENIRCLLGPLNERGVADAAIDWAMNAPVGSKFNSYHFSIEVVEGEEVEEKEMNKFIYRLTNAEIICLAIKGMEPEIRKIAMLLEKCKNADAIKTIESGYGETIWKFGRLMGLYKLETGKEHDLIKEFPFVKED